MKEGGSLSIWFFVGISLLVNGVLIFGAGVWEVTSHASNPVLTLNHHANIWWGGLLAVLGAIYSWKYSPSKMKAS